MRSRPASLKQSVLNRSKVIAMVIVLACTCGNAQSPATAPPITAPPTTAPPTTAPSDGGELAAACEKAKQSFREITDKDVEAALNNLRQAAGQLDRRMESDTANGPAWKKFLKWDLLQEQLAPKQTPSLKALDAVYGKYASGNIGLQLSCFNDVRNAIRSYLTIVQAKSNPKLKAGYDTLLNNLATQLQKHSTQPTPQTATSISLSIRWLEDVHQAHELRVAIARAFGRHNLLIEVSSKMVAAGIDRPVDDTGPVTDYILGTSVRGTAHTVGNTTAELVEDKQRATIDILFKATANSDTIGHNGPVVIYSKGTTNISARKRLFITEHGVSSLPTRSSAVTDTTITCIRDKKDRDFVVRMAKKRAGKKKCEAEQIAAKHAEQRINRRIDEQAAEGVDKAHENFVKKFRKPLTERSLFPQHLGFSSVPQSLNIAALQANSFQLAAPNDPPEIAEGADLALRIHDSMLNNFTTNALSGVTVDNETFHAAIIDLFGELPEKLKEDDQDPWSISFTRGMPISVQFANDEISMTIRGRKFRKGEDTHPGMNISVKYKIEKTDAGFKLVRQGEPQVFPPGFVPGGGKSIGVRYQVIRTILEQRFGRIFVKEIVPKGIELSDKLASLGKLKPIQIVSRDGWLILAWKAEKAE